MLRFALLWHDCPGDYRDGPHYDFCVERSGVRGEHRLATWSLLTLPSEWAERLGRGPDGGASVDAAELADHRAAYLDYEGPIGGGRGTVYRVAGGRVDWLDRADSAVGLRLGNPEAIGGEVVLRPIADRVWRLSIALDGLECAAD